MKRNTDSRLGGSHGVELDDVLARGRVRPVDQHQRLAVLPQPHAVLQLCAHAAGDVTGTISLMIEAVVACGTLDGSNSRFEPDRVA